jgi:hypothetical protein
MTIAIGLPVGSVLYMGKADQPEGPTPGPLLPRPRGWCPRGLASGRYRSSGFPANARVGQSESRWRSERPRVSSPSGRDSARPVSRHLCGRRRKRGREDDLECGRSRATRPCSSPASFPWRSPERRKCAPWSRSGVATKASREFSRDFSTKSSCAASGDGCPHIGSHTRRISAAATPARSGLAS